MKCGRIIEDKVDEDENIAKCNLVKEIIMKN